MLSKAKSRFLSGKKIIFIFLLLIIHCSIPITHAQWVRLGGPGGAMVECITTSGNFIFTGTAGAGIYRSQNQGLSWTNVGFMNYYVKSILAINSNIFAGVSGEGIFLSTNNGSNWISVNSGLSNLNFGTLISSGFYIFAGSYGGGVFWSTNNGGNWVSANNGLTNLYINSLAVSGNNVFAGTSGGVFRSTNYGINWIAVNNGLTNININSLTIVNNNIVSGTLDSGIYISTNNGLNWNHAGLSQHTILCLVSFLSYIIAGTADAGIFLTSNNGTNWIQKNEGFNFYPLTINTLFINLQNIFTSLSQPTIWKRSISDIIIGINYTETEIPENFSLSQNYPNPFNVMTKIKFEIPSYGFPLGARGNDNVVLKIFDITGREIKTLVNDKLNPGAYEVTFDGSNYASGIYFYQLKSDSFSETKKLILLK